TSQRLCRRNQNFSRTKIVVAKSAAALVSDTAYTHTPPQPSTAMFRFFSEKSQTTDSSTKFRAAPRKSQINRRFQPPKPLEKPLFRPVPQKCPDKFTISCLPKRKWGFVGWFQGCTALQPPPI
ncbi:hypothetical protein, partial [Rhizobium terrae]|uniref:hypothetical protein n=1 Tax=Rhizobium terrae TaxID=2171756 RepID=UPI0019682FD6